MIRGGMEPHPLTTTFELIGKAQGGSAEARNRLFERYYPRVLRVVRVRVGPELRRREDLDAVAQRSFAAALAAFDALDGPDEGRLIHWLSETAEARVRGGEGAAEPPRSSDRGDDAERHRQ